MALQLIYENEQKIFIRVAFNEPFTIVRASFRHFD
jgi:hypothetical protein